MDLRINARIKRSDYHKSVFDGIEWGDNHRAREFHLDHGHVGRQPTLLH